MSDADKDVVRMITERSWVPSPSRRQLILASMRIRARIQQLTRERTAGASTVDEYWTGRAV